MAEKYGKEGEVVSPTNPAANDFVEERLDMKEPTESVKSHHLGELDPFIPFPDDDSIPHEENSQILTIRAVLVGCILGGLVNASNVYLGMDQRHLVLIGILTVPQD